MLANDSDVDGGTLTINSVGTAGHGIIINNGDGSLTYTATLGWTGTDTFTYTISDGQGGTSTGTVTVVVTQTANHLTAVADNATTAEDNCRHH